MQRDREFDRGKLDDADAARGLERARERHEDDGLFERDGIRDRRRAYRRNGPVLDGDVRRRRFEHVIREKSPIDNCMGLVCALPVGESQPLLGAEAG
jgi:hypothetical protein